ncbi:hypothetical protein JCM10213v2_006044 [Rhodosporidiobolus nylandii]
MEDGKALPPALRSRPATSAPPCPVEAAARLFRPRHPLQADIAVSRSSASAPIPLPTCGAVCSLRPRLQPPFPVDQYIHALKCPVPKVFVPLANQAVEELILRNKPPAGLSEAETKQFWGLWNVEWLEFAGDRRWHDIIATSLFFLRKVKPLAPPSRANMRDGHMSVVSLSTNAIAARLAREVGLDQYLPRASLTDSRRADVFEAYLQALYSCNGSRALLEFLCPLVKREYLSQKQPQLSGEQLLQKQVIMAPDYSTQPTKLRRMQPLTLVFTSRTLSPGDFLATLDRAGVLFNFRHTSGSYFFDLQGVKAPAHLVNTKSLPDVSRIIMSLVKRGRAKVASQHQGNEGPRCFGSAYHQQHYANVLRSFRSGSFPRWVFSIVFTFVVLAHKRSLGRHSNITCVRPSACDRIKPVHVANTSRDKAWEAAVQAVSRSNKVVVINPKLKFESRRLLPLRYRAPNHARLRTDLLQLVTRDNMGQLKWTATLSLPDRPQIAVSGGSSSFGSFWQMLVRQAVNTGIVQLINASASPTSPQAPDPLRFPDIEAAARDLRAALEQGGYEFTLRLEGRRTGRTHILNIKGWEQVSANQRGTRQGVKSRYPLVKACIEHGYIVIGESSPAEEEAAVASTPSSPPAPPAPAPPDYSINPRVSRKAPPPPPLTFATKEEAVRSLLGTLSDKDIPFLAVWNASTHSCYLRLPGYVAWTGTLLGKSHAKPAEVSFARAVRGAITSGAIVIGENSAKTASGNSASSPPLVPSSSLSSTNADPQQGASPAQLASYHDLIEDLHAEVAGAATPTTQTSDSPLPPLRNYKHCGRAVLDFGKVLSSTHPRATLYRFWLRVPGYPVAYREGIDTLGALERMIGSAKIAGSFVDCDVDPSSSDLLALEQQVVELCKAGLGSLDCTLTLRIPGRRLITVRADRSRRSVLDVWQLLVYTAARQGIVSFESASTSSPVPDTTQFDSTSSDVPLDICASSLSPKDEPAPRAMDLPNPASSLSPSPTEHLDAQLQRLASPRRVPEPPVAVPDTNAILAAAGLPTSPEPPPPSVAATPSTAPLVVEDSLEAPLATGGEDVVFRQQVGVEPKQDGSHVAGAAGESGSASAEEPAAEN